jgi:hypothetical protein
MKYESVSFNDDYVLTMTRDQFIADKTNDHLWDHLPGHTRLLMLGEVYDLIVYAHTRQLVKGR